MPDLPDWSQSVSIDAASVTIPVSGTVSITSGTVTIANASIAVINATGTKITSARPPVLLQQIFQGPGGSGVTTTAALPTDLQALVLVLSKPLANYTHIKVAWHTPAGMLYVPLELFQFTQQVYAIPLLPQVHDDSTDLLNTLDVVVGAAAGLEAVVELVAIFESSPLWLELFPLPQLEPNQTPLMTNLSGTATGAAAWLIVPVANVQITVFRIITQAVSPVGSYIGYGSTLPIALPTPPSPTLIRDIAGTYRVDELSAVQLPRGNGIWAWNFSSGVWTTADWLVIYSLS